MGDPRTATSRTPAVNGVVPALKRLLIRKPTVPWLVCCWTGAVALLAAAGLLDATAAALALLLGAVLVQSLQSYRQRRLTHRRLAETRHQVLAVRQSVAKVHDGLTSSVRAVESASTGITGAVEAARRATVVEASQAFRQFEALLNLYSMIPVEGRVPPTRGWAASPDLLLLLTETLRTERPKLVVECGSGVSTLWCALAVRQFGLDARVVALEHDERFRAETIRLLDSHGVADLAEVVYAPLEPVEVAGETWKWYSKEGWADLRDIGVLFVDGPPESTGAQARFPALPLLGDRLSDDAVVILDDVIRKDEQAILKRWLADAPTVREERLSLEKGAAVLRRDGSTPGSWTDPGTGRGARV